MTARITIQSVTLMTETVAVTAITIFVLIVRVLMTGSAFVIKLD